MTYEERNNTIKDLTTDFQQIHDHYTSTSRILTDSEWEEYIESMNAKLNKYKNTNLYDVLANLWMAFLNDTEDVQRKLRRIHGEKR